MSHDWRTLYWDSTSPVFTTQNNLIIVGNDAIANFHQGSRNHVGRNDRPGRGGRYEESLCLPGKIGTGGWSIPGGDGRRSPRPARHANDPRELHRGFARDRG